MQRSNQTAIRAHRKMQSSSTLNRRYVKKPIRSTDGMVSVKRSPKIQRYSATSSASRMTLAGSKQTQLKQTNQPMSAPVKTHPIQAAARARMSARASQSMPAPASKMTAKELKDQAIKKALASASNSKTMAETITKSSKPIKKTPKLHFSLSRIILALSCATATVFAIAYFVSLSAPDISLKVAAMQTGIEASYPNYIPRDFKLSGITSEAGKISLNFTHSSSDDTFTIVEEKSSWDSQALLSNYVKDTFGENYSIIKEQGLTIYVSGSDATWVNGGIVYKLTATKDSLTNKQIRSIAVSL